MVGTSNVLATDKDLPILEPDLNGSLGHVDVLCDAFPSGRSGCGILVKFNFEGDQLILRGPLAFVVLLLLSQSAFARRAARSRVRGCRRGA